VKHARADYDSFQDPLGIIPEDEPVFLIRGQDVCGPAAVESWASMAASFGASREIVDHALKHAMAMREYQTRSRQFKIPDMPKGK
jgi:hypothetical protein